MRKHTDNPNQLETSSLSAIEHILQYRPEMIRSLRLSDRENPRLQAIEALAAKKGVKAPRERGLPEGESAVAILAPFSFIELKRLVQNLESEKRALIVALDHVQDPQNLGAICRTSEALGVKAILIPKHRSVSVTGTVFSASAGAAATLPICLVSNLNEGLRQLKEAGYWVIGSTLAEGATGFDKMPDFEKMVLVLGAEGDGMGQLTESLCDWKLQIPLKGSVQSLNVGAAGAICIYELMKRQQAG